MDKQLVIWLAEHRTPFWDTFFEWATLLGEQYAFILIIGYVYWNVSKKYGMIVTFSYLFSMFLNDLTKMAVQRPRPFQLLPDIAGQRLHTATGYALPSGHTQGAASFYTALSLWIRKTWFWAVAMLIILLVAVSRVYLGVHWPSDVVAAIVLGILISWIIVKMLQRYYNLPGVLRKILTATAVIVFLTLIALLIIKQIYPDFYIGNFVRIAGVLLGAVIGFRLESSYLGFSEPAKVGLKWLRFIIGIATTIGVMLGLKLIFPQHDIADALRYFLTGFWLSFAFPYLGHKTGLFRRNERKFKL